MSYSVEYNSEKECIYVTVEGELDMELFQSLAKEAGKLIKQYNCRRILNDMREALLPDSAGDIYFMPKKAAGAGVGVGVKRALVVPDLSRDYRFMETVFVNQGNAVRVFDSLEPAEEWLFSE